MDMRPLGRTGMTVSSVCLGTMTWGNQNTEAEACEQLDYALERGVNFIDAAEMYPVPADGKTQGRTEAYIGNWHKARGNRDAFILASKVAGRSGMTYLRDQTDQVRHTPAQIDEALEKSLRRLQTDYIDLYQLHWPDRQFPGSGFGHHSFHDYPTDDMVALEDILDTLNKHVEAGKIRSIGLSNESSWGAMKYLQIAEAKGQVRPASIQNAYNLVSRRYDYGLAEVSCREDIGLLAYSPLAQGYLTGKYRDGIPKNSRKDLFGNFLGRYERHDGVEAVNACLDAAQELGITATQFALKFVESRDFVTSNIIGATTMEQLKDNIDAHDIEWTEAMEDAADKIHRRYRSPAC